MTTRRNKTLLPILTNKNTQKAANITINIPYQNTTHNSPPPDRSSKWILTQSHVEKHITPKKIKFPNNIQINAMPNLAPLQSETQQKNVFFTGINRRQEKPQQKQRLSQAEIQSSTKFIDLLKSNKKKLLKIRLITEPAVSNHSNVSPKRNQLFSYFQRDFVNSKRQNINSTVVEKFKSQSPEKIFSNIEVKSRKFLLDKMHRDYMNYNKIEGYKKQSIKGLIEEQIERKKKEFKQDYSKRYSSPYFYYLSLSKEEKSNVLLRKQLSYINSI